MSGAYERLRARYRGYPCVAAHTCNPEIGTAAILGLLKRNQRRPDIKSTYKRYGRPYCVSWLRQPQLGSAVRLRGRGKSTVRGRGEIFPPPGVKDPGHRGYSCGDKITLDPFLWRSPALRRNGSLLRTAVKTVSWLRRFRYFPRARAPRRPYHRVICPSARFRAYNRRFI